MIKYRIDVIQALKEKGYTTYRIRQEKIFGEAALQHLRDGKLVSWKVFDCLCQILECQPTDLIEYVEDK